jgi:hypothetical protein
MFKRSNYALRMGFLLGVALISLVFSGCNKIKPLSSSLSGSSVTLKTDCLLFPSGPTKQRAFGVDYELTPKNSDNEWRKDGWIKAGSSLYIHEIKLVKVDARGEWVAVLGQIYDPRSAQVRSFVYPWTLGGMLRRAPWENNDVPEFRPPAGEFETPK